MQQQQSKKQNLADEIYAIFKSRDKIALRRNDLFKAFKAKYCRPLIMMDLRELPFVRFDSKSGGHKSIHLSIELDDCCTKCKWDYCKLLHSVSISDKFETILKRPRIRLIQRLKNILTISETVTLSELKRRHNSQYAEFKSHEPTASGIDIRFKSTFHVQYDEDSNDYVVTYKKNSKQHHTLSNGHSDQQHLSAMGRSPRLRHNKTRNNNESPQQLNRAQKPKTNKLVHAKANAKKDEIIPDQCNKAYLYVDLDPKWQDSKLIPDLVRHISQLTGKHIADAYIPNRKRLGFFTAKNQRIAQNFVTKAQTQRMRCWTRVVNAEIVPLPKNTNYRRTQHGVRVRVTNVNNVMGKKDFESWVLKMTQTERNQNLVYDIEIVFPVATRHASHCILLFDQDEDVQYVQNKLKNSKFRKCSLSLKQWYHPKAKKASQINVDTSQKRMRYKDKKNGMMHQQKMANHVRTQMNVIKSSKPQTKSIWATMANERKERKERLSQDRMTKSEIIEIEKSLLIDVGKEKKNRNHRIDDEKKNIFKPMKKKTPVINGSDSKKNGGGIIGKEEITLTQQNGQKVEMSSPSNKGQSQPQKPTIYDLLQQQVNALPPQQQLIYLQQLQLQQQLQRAPIRMVNINQMQQLQQLQQQSAHPQMQIPIPITQPLPNIPVPPPSIQNVQYPPFDLSMQPFLSQMPPPPSAFRPVKTTKKQQNNSQNNWTQQQRTEYQTPPRHNQQNINQNVMQKRQNVMIQSQFRPPIIANKMKQNSPSQQQQQQETNANAKNKIPKSNGLMDKLCQYCLLSDHEPSKCVWFNPNLYKNQKK